MIEISPGLTIDENELRFNFVQASGPGGQNVNKVASAVQLRFDILNSASLPEDVRKRLTVMARNRISEDGILIIEAKQFRSQEQNKRDAVDRLVQLIHRASQKPKTRVKTRPTAAAKRRRLEAKRQRGEIKRLRQGKPGVEQE